MAEFPEMKGFSLSNLKYIRQWYLFYNQGKTIGEQPVGQLAKHFVLPRLRAMTQNLETNVQISPRFAIIYYQGDCRQKSLWKR